jgi:putative Mg2+ transporter-C (MgtC) family protein
MAAGGGMYAVATFVTAVGLVALTLLRRFEDRREQAARQRITLLLDESLSPIPTIVEALLRAGANVSEQEYELTRDVGVRVTFDVRTSRPVDGHQLARALDAAAGVKQLKIERL